VLEEKEAGIREGGRGCVRGSSTLCQEDSREQIQQCLCIQLQLLKIEDRSRHGILGIYHEGENILFLMFPFNMSSNQVCGVLSSASPSEETTSNTFVRPSRTNRGSGMNLRNGISQGIPSSYLLIIFTRNLNQADKLNGLPNRVKQIPIFFFLQCQKALSQGQIASDLVVNTIPTETYIKRKACKPFGQVNRPTICLPFQNLT